MKKFMQLEELFQKPLFIKGFEVSQISCKFRNSFKSTKLDLDERPLTLLKLVTNVGESWGECAALATPFYTDETADSCAERLRENLLPELVGNSVSIAKLSTLVTAGNEMGFAAVESAMLTALINAHGWPQLDSDREVFAGAVVSEAAAERVLPAVNAGYRRIKIKVNPATTVESIQNLIELFPNIQFDADGNESFTADDYSQALALLNAGLTVFEQPFERDNLDSAQKLVEACSYTQRVCADEAAISIEATMHVLSAGAANSVSLKPSRLGGIYRALKLTNELHAAGYDFLVGGMFEAGLGRSLLAWFAEIGQAPLVGDIAPASFHFEDQPFSDLSIEHGRCVLPEIFC